MEGGWIDCDEHLAEANSPSRGLPGFFEILTALKSG